MDLLLWLQSIRTPALDAFFLLVTKLGEDTFLLLPILLFYWCLDKRIGLRLGFIAFFSSLANQTTKLIFRVERPFVQNPTLQPVEGARAGATGYSFPSGHSTSATSLGMALILTFRKKWWIWLCSILYVALVCFSRLYLGVHTPADVLTGFLMTVVVSLIVHALFNDSDKHPERKDLYLILSMLLSLGALAWGLVVVSTGLAPAELSVDIFKIAGAALGMLIGVMVFYMVRSLSAREFSKGAKAALTVLNVVVSALLLWYILWQPTYFKLERWTVAFLCIALITLSLLNRDYLTAALNNKVTNSIFGYLGSISLYIYMLHYPVVIATLRILGHNTPETIYSFWTVYIPATVATVVLSALVNEIMKRTIMKKK